jgi:hypothetical protein
MKQTELEIIESYINDDIKRFSLRRKSEFRINLDIEPDIINKAKLWFYPVVVKYDDINYKPFTISFEDIDFIYYKSAKKIQIKIPYEENKYFFIAIRQMYNGIIKNYSNKIEKLFYNQKNGICSMDIRVLKNISKILSFTGEKLDVYGGDLSKIVEKTFKARYIRIQFFIFNNGSKSFCNTRLISMQLEEPIQEIEKLDIDNFIPFEEFKILNIDKRILYYSSHLKNYNDNLNNITYGWIGINIKNDEDNVYACNFEDVNYFKTQNYRLQPNTFLVSKSQALKKKVNKYIDREQKYHYFVTLMFSTKHHDDKPTKENKINLYKVVKNYLSRRLIDVLGFWYDQATPPTSCIHFNLHIRSILDYHYFFELFRDWSRNHGKVYIDHIFDPLMGRLYLSRNNNMFNFEQNIEYKDYDIVKKEARLVFAQNEGRNLYNFNFINFLNTKFSKDYLNIDNIINSLETPIYNPPCPPSPSLINLIASIKNLIKILNNDSNNLNRDFKLITMIEPNKIENPPTDTLDDKTLDVDKEILKIINKKKMNKIQLLELLQSLDNN